MSTGPGSYTSVKDHCSSPGEFFCGCTSSQPLATAAARTWAVVQNLWPPCQYNTPFRKRINEESQKQCSGQTDIPWRRLVVCSSSLSPEGRLWRDPSAKNELPPYFYWRWVRFSIDAAGRWMDLVNTVWSFSCTQRIFPQHFLWTARLREQSTPASSCKVSNRKAKLNFREKHKSKTPGFHHVSKTIGHVRHMLLCEYIVLWARPTWLCMDVLWGPVRSKYTGTVS